MEPVSFNPADFVEGGGLWQRGKVRWVNPRFVSAFDYKNGSQAPCFMVDMIDLEDGNAMEPQVWSVGKLNDFMASKDGKTPAPDGQGSFLLGPALVKTCNFALLMNSLAAAIPDAMKVQCFEKVFTGMNANNFDGFEVEMIRIEPDRPGLEKTKRGGKEYAKQVLVVDAIIKYPWEKKAPGAPPGTAASKAPARKATPAPAAQAAPAPAPAPAAAAATGKATPPPRAKAAAKNDPAVDDQARAIVSQIIEANPDGLMMDDLLTEIYQQIAEPKMRTAVLAKVNDPAWMTENGPAGGFEFVAESNAVYPVTEG